MCQVDSPFLSQSLLFKYFTVHHSPVILHSTLCGLRYREHLKVIHKTAHLIDNVHRKYLSHEMDGPGFEDRQVRERLLFSKTVQTNFEAHSVFDLKGIGVLCPPGGGGGGAELGDRGMKLTTHLHLVPKLRMREAVPLLPQYTVMTRTGVVFLFITEK